MTKQEVRAVILSKLAVGPKDICWDVGAGTGSVSVELALQARAVWAVERDSATCALIRANREKMAHNLHNSLMLVTALNPYIGYENAAKTAKKAYKENISLKEACVALGFLTAERFDEVFHPEQMV